MLILQRHPITGTFIVVGKNLEKRTRQLIKLNDMQFSCIGGESTTAAVFLIRHLKELFAEKIKTRTIYLIISKKAFDRVPRELIPWALKQQGSRKSSTTNNLLLLESKTRVRRPAICSDCFENKVGVHQGPELAYCCL